MTGLATTVDPAVTGIGVHAPTGVTVADYWRNTLAGRSAIDRITRFDPSPYTATLAGEIRDFDPSPLSGRLLPQTDISTRHALVSSDAALRDAGITPDDRDDFELGVVTASTSGGFEFGQKELQKLWAQGSRHVSGYQSFAWFYAVNTGQLAIRHGARGPSSVVVADQAGSLDAVGKARRLVRAGTPLVLTGGFDSVLSPWGWLATLAAGNVSTSTDPKRAYQPFADTAEGFVPGEGGALTVLEHPDRARDRGARVYAHISGYASGFDPRPGSPRPPALARIIRAALADARLAPEDVGVVFADAAGVREQDDREIAALDAVFGVRGVPVTAPKTGTGRLFAGGGALDIAAAALALDSRTIPPTPGLEHYPDPTHLDLVREPRELTTPAALVLARGGRGFTSAVVLRGVR
ncbi:beta-ketoacyl synthase N-terminal-like domain-containing protein [Nocardia sp. NPDC101769]|uniref:beta-ketoacyl synthase N-terminal-like domain-containing protein n=1 Tax=Nocardia sp. NPDC101769 TaxID=3364333 RepID=UPI0038059F17